MRALATVARHADGIPYRVVGVNEDITHAKIAEEALRESEDRFGGLFKYMSQGVVIQDEAGSILDANPAAEEILGLELAQLQGLVSSDPRWRATDKDGNDLPGEQHPISVALTTGSPCCDFTMGVFRPVDEQMRWLKVDAYPRFRNGGDTPFQAFAVFSDITDALANQAALEKASADAVQANQAKSDFLANMSHEIRTPMNGVLGTSELLLDTQLNDDQRKLTHTIVDSAESLLTIINDILDFSKIESGKMDIEEVEVDLKRVLHSTIESLKVASMIVASNCG